MKEPLPIPGRSSRLFLGNSDLSRGVGKLHFSFLSDLVVVGLWSILGVELYFLSACLLSLSAEIGSNGSREGEPVPTGLPWA